MKRHDTRALVLIALSLLGCNVESTTKGTGGVGQSTSGITCPSGTVVALSDWTSSQIALSDLEGNTLSASFLSTGSAQTDGLSFALSGDVRLPSTRPSGGRIVILDRFGTNVVSWVDPATAQVLAQLPVGTGFESNPSDYLEVSTNRALITRWGDNAHPGEQAFDGGGDILLIDTEKFEIVDAISLPRALADGQEAIPPRPSGMTRIGDTVLVSLERLRADFSGEGTAIMAGISISESRLKFTLTLEGLKACGRPALSPNGKQLAVACGGELSGNGEVSDLSQSAVVLLDATKAVPTEIRRLSAESIAGEALQSEVVFARDDLLLLKTQTALGGSANNRWLSLELNDDLATTLLEARTEADGKGKGLAYGGMSCSPGCSELCLLADGDRGVLQRVRVGQSGEPTLESPVRVETSVGLPPRDVSLR